ncbi:hypothetical protein C8R44DRAFT_735720 [Mycena epipterygia]|nr:hypothetical protein C8R44DRAFT_735720 [Mycena epipterygia]
MEGHINGLELFFSGGVHQTLFLTISRARALTSKMCISRFCIVNLLKFGPGPLHRYYRLQEAESRTLVHSIMDNPSALAPQTKTKPEISPGLDNRVDLFQFGTAQAFLLLLEPPSNSETSSGTLYGTRLASKRNPGIDRSSSSEFWRPRQNLV